MVALWGALKSVLLPGDVVVSVCNGVYGDGIASMAEGLGATVQRVGTYNLCTLHLLC
jgi:aspartate aminotransferase-like enzyme